MKTNFAESLLLVGQVLNSSTMSTPKKYEHIDFVPPEGVKEEADRALRWKEEYPDDVKGGTDVGWTRARQLSKRETLSPDIIKRMVSFFARHKQNKNIADKYKGTPWKDRGYIAWLIWGGDPGEVWANKVLNQIRRADANEDPTMEEIDPAVEQLDWHSPIEIGIADGELVTIEDLDDTEIIEPEVVPSTENLDDEPNQEACNQGDSPPPPPPAPALFKTEKGVTAFLYGNCESTVDPLLHLLSVAGEEDEVCIEINSPRLNLARILSVATAVEHCKAKTKVTMCPAYNMLPLLIFLSANESEFMRGAQIFQALAHYTTGSSQDMSISAEEFRKYADHIFGCLVEHKLLTPEEVETIDKKDAVFAITTEELNTRMKNN